MPYIAGHYKPEIPKVSPSSKSDKSFEKFSINVQKKIRNLRIENELSQEDLMDYGLSLRTIQRIENTAQPANITLLTLFRLANAFGIKPGELLDI